ncbi:hypothetical protein ACQKJG_18485 [Priestia megaterium]|uniref:hypothetical protein n=1 Tax=Priestia megaterium TaxID=1404 RepID=UPI003D05B5F5
MSVQTINGKSEMIGSLKVKWYLTPSQTFKVTIFKLDRNTVIKEWEFEESPITEAISHSWYEYVLKSLEQHIYTSDSLGLIPKFLKETTTNDAEELLLMVLERLKAM